MTYGSRVPSLQRETMKLDLYQNIVIIFIKEEKVIRDAGDVYTTLGSSVHEREGGVYTTPGLAAVDPGESSVQVERRRLRTVDPQPQVMQETHEHHHQTMIPRPKTDFPKFEYSNPRMWIKMVERYFMLSQTPVALYLDYLTIHLNGKVAIWFEGYVSSLRGGFHWGLFVEAVCRSFGSRNLSIGEEFTALKQLGSVDEFTEKYEEMRSLLLQESLYLTEEYFLQNYICRLKPTLRCFVRTSLPMTLEDAIWFAKQFEQG